MSLQVAPDVKHEVHEMQSTLEKTKRLSVISTVSDLQFDTDSLSTESHLTHKERLEFEYLKNRDPMREFFALTLKSVKLNSPHLSLVAEIKEQDLYDKAKNVPFY